MIKEKIVTELKYYQKYLGELISHFYINEAICDLYDLKRSIIASLVFVWGIFPML